MKEITGLSKKRHRHRYTCVLSRLMSEVICIFTDQSNTQTQEITNVFLFYYL